MKKQSHFVYIATAISMLVPATGRFATGIIACLSVIFISFFGTIISQIITNLVPKNTSILYQFFVVVLLGTIFNELLKIFSPVLSIYMYVTVYLTAFSSMIIGFFFNTDSEMDFQQRLSHTMKNTFTFCLFALIFFFLRDYIGYQTITFPVQSGFLEYKLPTLNLFTHSFFWGSIPFAIFLLGLTLSLITFISRRFDIVRRKLY